jgi:hypothetical protein
MNQKPAIGVAVLAIGLLSACSNTSSAPRVASAPTVDPTMACLQLHDWQLHNHGQGISTAFGQQLEAETRGTQLGTDIAQWLQDLGVNPNQFSSSPGAIESYMSQTASDAAAVGTDCEGYGVRNTLGDLGGG